MFEIEAATINAIEISADEITPLFYSSARLFRRPAYCLYAEIIAARGFDFILYSIGKLDSLGCYDQPEAAIYSSDSLEDILDVWSIFR